MLKSYKFWFRFGAWALLVTGLLHSLSLIHVPVGENDAERQMIEMMTTVKLGGIDRTMYNLYFFFSLNLSLSSVFLAILNLILAKYYMPSEHAGKLVTANFIYWSLFLVPLTMLTFIVPVICYAIGWLGFLLAFLLLRKKAAEALNPQ